MLFIVDGNSEDVLSGCLSVCDDDDDDDGPPAL